MSANKRKRRAGEDEHDMRNLAAVAVKGNLAAEYYGENRAATNAGNRSENDGADVYNDGNKA